MNETVPITRRDQRREAILAVAKDVFFEEGYSAASMSMIAARLGGSKGTLYNYFKSKEELFSAHIQHQCGLVTEEVFNQMGEDQRVEAVLTLVGERLLSHIVSEWSLHNFRLVIAEAKRAPELAQIFYRAGPGAGQTRLTAYLEGAKQRGLIDPPDCRRAATQFISLCRADIQLKFVLNLITAPDSAAITREVAAAVSMFMAAYGVAKRPG